MSQQNETTTSVSETEFTDYCYMIAFTFAERMLKQTKQDVTVNNLARFLTDCAADHRPQDILTMETRRVFRSRLHNLGAVDDEPVFNHHSFD